MNTVGPIWIDGFILRGNGRGFSSECTGKDPQCTCAQPLVWGVCVHVGLHPYILAQTGACRVSLCYTLAFCLNAHDAQTAACKVYKLIAHASVCNELGVGSLEQKAPPGTTGGVLLVMTLV
jgi:hypothetical protein